MTNEKYENMLTKEELKGTYIKYDESITEEIFNKILKRAKECEDTDPYNFFINNFENFKTRRFFWFKCRGEWGDNCYSYGVDNNYQRCKQIQVSDILGEDWDKSKIEKSSNGYSDNSEKFISGYYNPIECHKLIRKPTSEELKWVKTCIKQDKFIPKSELDKYDDEGNLLVNKEESKSMKDFKYPEYVKCIEYRNDAEEYIVGKIYKVENNRVRTEQGYLSRDPLPTDLLNHYGNTDFEVSTKEAYKKQSFEKLNKSELDIWIENNKNFSGTIEELTKRLRTNESIDSFISQELWEQIPGYCSTEKAEYLWELWEKDSISVKPLVEEECYSSEQKNKGIKLELIKVKRI